MKTGTLNTRSTTKTTSQDTATEQEDRSETGLLLIKNGMRSRNKSLTPHPSYSTTLLQNIMTILGTDMV
jgi:hypothetical protein